MLHQSLRALLLLGPSLLLGCSTTAPTQLDPAFIGRLNTMPAQQSFSHDNPLLDKASFNQAVQAIIQSQDEQTLDAQLYYLRAFSYFGPMDALTSVEYAALTDALNKLGQSKLVSQSARLQEHFAVTLYRYYANTEEESDEHAEQVGRLLPLLNQQLSRIANQSPSLATDYALWETLRAYGMLLNAARKQPEGTLNQQLIAARLDKPLLDFAASPLSLHGQRDWPRANAYWALGLYRLALPSGDEGKITPAEQALDDAMAEMAERDVARRGDAAKTTYTLGYHVNAFAGQEACKARGTICQIPEQSQILPIRHKCSDSLYILAQDLTPDELSISCTKLTSQEAHFHQLLKTKHRPTANDNNDALQVVAFKNWSQYNAYGQLLFDIGTDNGGIYIEGTPSNPDNQASFFAYRQFWIAPEFAIWNLNHEYVHYLDGRFVKYGGFGHFPSKLVWWSEGLAEYVSKGNDNPSTLKVIKEKLDEAPDLKTIFATEYKDGLDRTYKWSYMAIRFLAEQHPEELVHLSHYLKTDYFEGYEKLLDELSEQQEAFSVWLTQQVADFKEKETNKTPKINKLNRYAYRDYLMPAHLKLDSAHQHF
ncbi:MULTISPECIES: collagenase [Shewanella]|uniref:collagenase n=1 Tax=Shewanella TaxID=22 RepID=UPI001EFDDC06|nr:MULTISPECIES: collagenase [Shewanella]MCG9748738.1 collagenase [Shewanella sp. Isolate8]MCL2912025.1 collagenase [Shewanella aquimarina]